MKTCININLFFVVFYLTDQSNCCALEDDAVKAPSRSQQFDKKQEPEVSSCLVISSTSFSLICAGWTSIQSFLSMSVVLDFINLQ